MNTLCRSIHAGIMIGIGGTVYLSCDNKYIGAFLFAIGLFIILRWGSYLFTGKVGFILSNSPKYTALMIPILIGNFIGTFLVGTVLQYTRFSPQLIEKAQTIVQAKLTDDPYSILILSFFCGMLMFIAASNFICYDKLELTGILSCFIAVMVFILCGFEHCIANMFYVTIAGQWSLQSALYIGLMILGNTLGGIFAPILKIISGDKPKKIKVATITANTNDEEQMKRFEQELKSTIDKLNEEYQNDKEDH